MISDFLSPRFYSFALAWQAIPALFTEIDKRVAMLDALPTMKAKRAACPIMSPRKGNTSPVQTRMLPLNAIAWQAAMVICGVRKISGTQSKLSKAQEKIGVVNVGVTLSSSTEASNFLTPSLGNPLRHTDKRSARFNACAGSTPACVFACVGSATGQGRQKSSWIARVGKTVALFHDPDRFVGNLRTELERRRKNAAKRDMRLAVRANVSADLEWLAGELARLCPGVDFYDYTANTSSMRLNDGVRRIYSLKDSPQRKRLALKMLRAGHGLSVVFRVTSNRTAKATRGQDYERGFELPPSIPVEGLGNVPLVRGDDHDVWYEMTTHEGETIRDLQDAGRPFIVGLKLKGTTSDQIDNSLDAGFAKSLDVFATA